MAHLQGQVSVAFNIFSTKSTKKDKASDTATPARVTRPRSDIKEILDMQDLKDDLPAYLAKKSQSRESSSARVNTPLGVDPKALAKAAAARIDAIEKEMALDLRGADASKLAPHPRAQQIATRSGFVRVSLPPGMAPVEPTPAPTPLVLPSQNTSIMMPEDATSMILGNTNLAQVIDVKESMMAPSVEEAAVLYANDQLDEAIKALLKAFENREQLGSSELNAYRILLDLLRIKGDQETFENVAMNFVIRYEKSPPSWDIVTKSNAPMQLSAIPTIDLGEVLDGSIVPALEQLKVLAQNSTVLRMDASHITSVEAEQGFGCELMLRVMRAFEHADYSLEVLGIPQLVSMLKPHLRIGNNAVSMQVWLLYLELLRMVNQQAIFEDRALEFAMTYEQSPPSWVPPSVKIKAARPEDDQPTTLMQIGRADHISLTGEIVGDGQQLVNQIAEGFENSMVVVCDCTYLIRLEFSAAAKLLTALTYWTADNKVVEFRNLNHPIAALFVTLGVHHMAVVERRRDA